MLLLGWACIVCTCSQNGFTRPASNWASLNSILLLGRPILGQTGLGAGVLLGLFTENKKENAPIISLLAQPIREHGY